MMSEEKFWGIVDTNKDVCDSEKRTEGLNNCLKKLDADELLAFDGRFHDLMNRAYHWDLWGAAFLIAGGCGDDSFLDFRSWLISKGRAFFDDAVRRPDSLAEADLGDCPEEHCFIEEFAYAASEVYEAITGDEMPCDRKATSPTPAGEHWEETNECLDLKKRLPQLYGKFWG